jgi:flagellar hook assembly protein FlgD
MSGVTVAHGVAGEEGRGSWDGKDDAGNNLASGVYLLRAEDASGAPKLLKVILNR